MSVYQSGAAPPTRGKRRPVSFVRKITLAQAWRMLRLIMSLNILVTLAALALMIAGFERTAGFLSRQTPQEAQRLAGLFEGTSAELLNGEWWQGISLDEQMNERLGLAPNSLRCAWLEQVPEGPFFGASLFYQVAAPTQQPGEYLLIRFDCRLLMIRFGYLAQVLLVCEIVLFILHTMGTKRSVRRTLAPIGQLAAATESISAEQVPHVRRQQNSAAENEKSEKWRRKQAMGALRREEKERQKKKKQEELELSGTIRTLNQITAGRLDTRIPIEGERRELQGLAAAINNMLDRLDAAYSSQLRFVSDASHELRTPIAVLQGYAHLLDRWGKDDPAVLQESIDAIKAESEGMQVLVEQLLFLARSDNNSIVMQMQPLDITSIAGEVLRETGMVGGRHVLVSEVDSALWTEGDAGLIKQALRVFVDNAVKYTPEGGQIKISAQRDGENLKIMVSDSGIGIPAEELSHVFERFFRADESRARATGGTGLGLSIAQWIVQRHGGHVEILSRQDIGTRITMVLPFCEQAEPCEGEQTGSKLVTDLFE